MNRVREEVLFEGVFYYRYPNSKNWSLRHYFGSPMGARRKKFLHRAIYESALGPIPRGHHIHHKDKNTLNNLIENLQCLSKESHEALHGKGTKVARGYCPTSVRLRGTSF